MEREQIVITIHSTGLVVTSPGGYVGRFLVTRTSSPEV